MSPDLRELFAAVLDYDPDRRRANHLLKVDSYAELIGLAEGMGDEERHWLRVACFLHDIGIKPSLEKRGSSDGAYQQLEGPPVAEGILAKYDCPRGRIERVKWLIAHHHEYSAIDGLDHRILVEADFLVNCDEGDMETEQIRGIRDKIFRTECGARMLETLFGL
ncbi:MAG: HD domain-containing protein [Planctomycetota bacterium]|jgi:hypothetical protein|nr:HD domain-containing protein [Planctomycetota bacterium]